MKKTLILLRHAHRDNSVRSKDNGLSEKGQRQSKWIRKFADKRFSKKDVHDLKAQLVSSPKLRCVETLQPVAELWDLSLTVRKDLDEMLDRESTADFRARILTFKDWWVNEAPPLLFVSTHGDWLPVATDAFLGLPIVMKKGAWLELEWDQGHFDLTCYIPGFKIFYGE